MIPKPRGTLSSALFPALTGDPEDLAWLPDVPSDGEEDAQIALWTLYELHYRDVDGVDAALEWHPDLLRLRHRLEQDLERRLRDRFPGHAHDGPFPEALLCYVDTHEGPALASFIHRDAEVGQVRDLLRHRSLYHLKEFDPTVWVVPRLTVPVKAALLELAFDEYGNGDPNRLHAHLFARGMTGIGLDSTPGAYVDDAPVEILEQNNAMSLFGLHRRLRAAALGHLAAFEATSSSPSRSLALGLRRLELDESMIDYYTEHVTADAIHDQLACRSICGALVAEDPTHAGEVFFGAFTCLDLEARYAGHMLEQWTSAKAATA